MYIKNRETCRLDRTRVAVIRDIVDAFGSYLLRFTK